MKFRKLRIAWSVAWGVAVVLLIVLWVHTLRYQTRGAAWVSKSHYVSFCTLMHWMEFDVHTYQTDPPRFWYPTPTFQDNPCTPDQLASASPVRHWRFQRHSEPDYTFVIITVPFWFPMLMMVPVAAVPWLPWWSNRFSLRTMLIATTLVAVILGAIVYAVR